MTSDVEEIPPPGPPSPLPETPTPAPNLKKRRIRLRYASSNDALVAPTEGPSTPHPPAEETSQDVPPASRSSPRRRVSECRRNGDTHCRQTHTTGPCFYRIHKSSTVRKTFKIPPNIKFMDHLPFEILSTIFILHFPIPPCSLYYEPLYPCRAEELKRLRLVSRRWNDAIVNTPELWSYIEVSDIWGNPSLFLQRSKAVPLHIRIKFSATSRLEGAVKAVWASADRWKTYVGYGNSHLTLTSLRLLPPCPLPIVEEVWLTGFVGNNQTFVQAPRMIKLVECSSAPVVFDITGAPSLKSWLIEFPRVKSEWERVIGVVQLCPLLESLEFLYSTFDVPSLAESGFTQVADHITFPALKELVMGPRTRRFDLFPYLRAPRLEMIVLQDYWEFIPFALPIPASCPSLSRIQFAEGSGLGAIQAWVSTVPKEISEGVGVEIEYYRERNACGVYEPGIPDFDSKWRKWFDENFPVKWIPVN